MTTLETNQQVKAINAPERKGWILALIVIVGFSLSVFFHYIVGTILGQPYPENTFLFNPHDWLNDFHNIFAAVSAGDPYRKRISCYPPFAYVPLIALCGLSSIAAAAIFLSGYASMVLIWCYQQLKQFSDYQRLLLTFSLSILTYPFIFCFDRANLEILVLAYLIGFVECHRRGHTRGRTIFLACATATKMYPGVLFLILLKERKYKDILMGGLLTLLFSCASAMLYPGGLFVTLKRFSQNLAYFKANYVHAPILLYNSSYWGILKYFVYRGTSYHPETPSVMIAYTVTCLILTGAVAGYLYLYETTFWKQLTLLIGLMILLPHVSYDYKLVLLLVPMFLFVAETQSTLMDNLYAVLFGFLMIPKAYIFSQNGMNPGFILNPLLITALMLSIMAEGMRASRTVFAA